MKRFNPALLLALSTIVLLAAGCAHNIPIKSKANPDYYSSLETIHISVFPWKLGEEWGETFAQDLSKELQAHGIRPTSKVNGSDETADIFRFKVSRNTDSILLIRPQEYWVETHSRQTLTYKYGMTLWDRKEGKTVWSGSVTIYPEDSVEYRNQLVSAITQRLVDDGMID